MRTSRRDTESIGEWEFITAGPTVDEVVSQTRWDSRGWTFQEAFVARRILIFATRQIFWVCHDSTWREDARLESQLLSESKKGSSLWGHCPGGLGRISPREAP